MMSKRPTKYRQLHHPDQGNVDINAASLSRQSSSHSQPRSGSGSIALESLVKNEAFSFDIERDGGSTEDPFLADYVQVTREDVELEIQAEFESLLIRESSVRRSCLHKGLISSVFFFVLLVVGIGLVEYVLPEEGFRDLLKDNDKSNDTCRRHLSLCFGLRAVRSIGLFGFFGGITNWVFIELLFRKVLCLIGTGVFITHHQDVIEGLRHIVIEILFDEEKLKSYISGKNRNIQKALQLNQQFEALLKSTAADQVIENKIDKFLSSPQGLLLTTIGANTEDARNIIKLHIRTLIDKISKIIYERLMIPGITDGGLKEEICSILEPRLSLMKPNDINKIITVMIRKHLSWLIIWGNVFGVMLGLLNEIIFIFIIKIT